MEILGYKSPDISRATLELKANNVPREGDLIFDFGFASEIDQQLMTDYRIHFMKSNGNLAPKTFKWTARQLKAGDEFNLSRKQTFKTINTRKHYPGRHKIEIIVNGISMAEAEFVLGS